MIQTGPTEREFKNLSAMLLARKAIEECKKGTEPSKRRYRGLLGARDSTGHCEVKHRKEMDRYEENRWESYSLPWPL